MEYVKTPFGEIKIFIDDIEIQYAAERKPHVEGLCPDVVGRYRIGVDFVPDGNEHEIKCIIENITYAGRYIESGERLECQAFYSADKWKLSIGTECEGGYYPDGRRW